MNIIKKISIVTLALFLTGALSAQEKSRDEKIDDLLKVTDNLPKVSGFMNLLYQNEDTQNGFSVKRARLNFLGNVGSSFTYRLQLEFASSPRILDAYIIWNATNNINLQAGQFKVPFTLESPISPLKLEAIEYPMAIAYLAGYKNSSTYGEVACGGRDQGAAVNGSFIKKEGYNVIEYAFGVFNGTGTNTSDDNKSKDIAGRVIVSPTKGLRLSASFRHGNYFYSDNSTAYRTRYSVGGEYKNSDFTVRSEFIHGFSHGTKSEGAYAVGSYNITKFFAPVVRYDYFSFNTENNDDRQTNYLIGTNFQFQKQIRLQLNYTLRTYKSDEDNSGLLGIMLSASF